MKERCNKHGELMCACDPPEPPDVYADACRPCRQGRCEDCAALGRCACCDTDEEGLA